jgi:hypothetical protein
MSSSCFIFSSEHLSQRRREVYAEMSWLRGSSMNYRQPQSIAERLQRPTWLAHSFAAPSSGLISSGQARLYYGYRCAAFISSALAPRRRQ